MEGILSKYLIQHNHCPLPGIGYLKLSAKPAAIHFGNKEIAAPTPEVLLLDKKIDPKDLVATVAATNNVSNDDALAALKNYCSTLKLISKKERVLLGSFGSFEVSEEGKLVFHSNAINNHFLPNLPLEKIIRQNAEHTMLVGNTETTNTQMEEYYQENEGSSFSKNWMAIIIIALLATTACIYYFANTNENRFGGNNTSINPVKAEKTYR